ncbi:hypothetical protein CAP39_08350 [Sphingomonas sp. IBVSS1]|nr:hypothetical protein CAP39_08350 [Sphingomonas sp. IBVSS1]
MMTGIELLLGCLSTKSLIETAVAGFIGNRVDAGGLACGRYLYQRLASDPQNPENHDVAKAVQTAWVRAMHWYGEQCLRAFRASTADWTERLAADAVSKAVQALDEKRPLPPWVPDATSLRTDAEALFAGGSPADQVARRSFAALEAATGPLPERLRQLFFEGESQTRSWPASFELLFAEQVKTNPRVTAITSYAALQALRAQGFDMAERLTRLTALADAGASELARINNQLGQIETTMTAGFAHTGSQLDQISAQLAQLMQAQAQDVPAAVLRSLAMQAGVEHPGADRDTLVAAVEAKLARYRALEAKYAAAEQAEGAVSSQLAMAQAATARADYAAADAALAAAEAAEAAEEARLARARQLRQADLRAMRANTAELAGRLAEAVALYDEAVALLPDDADEVRRRHAGDAALAGEALAVRLASPALLRDALTRWQALDEPALRQTDTEEWAKLRNNIGGLQSQLAILENDPALLGQAVENLLQAIDGFSLHSAPEHRARALVNLGRTLERLADEAGDPMPATAAVASHRNAIAIVTALQLPAMVAACQIGLADALITLARHSQDHAPLDEAISLLRALTADTTGLLSDDSQTLVWISLAHAHLHRSRISGDPEPLGPALAAATTASQRVAMSTQAGVATDAWLLLGRVQSEIANHQSDRQALGAAITAYEAALAVRTGQPRDRVWADLTTRLALAVAAHTILENEIAQLARAVALHDDVARFWEQAGGGPRLGAALQRLGEAQGDLGMARDDEALLATAVATLRAAAALLVDAPRPGEYLGARLALAEALILLAGNSADTDTAREGFGLLDALWLETSGHADLHAYIGEFRQNSQKLRGLFRL